MMVVDDVDLEPRPVVARRVGREEHEITRGRVLLLEGFLGLSPEHAVQFILVGVEQVDGRRATQALVVTLPCAHT
jgi:hypothetical protein